MRGENAYRIYNADGEHVATVYSKDAADEAVATYERIYGGRYEARAEVVETRRGW